MPRGGLRRPGSTSHRGREMQPAATGAGRGAGTETGTGTGTAYASGKASGLGRRREHPFDAEERPRRRPHARQAQHLTFQPRIPPTFVTPSSAMIRAVAVGAAFAVALYLIHHQLQIVYFRTCKANLLAVVLHHRSDVCYALNMAISAIERGYQQGILTLMQWGASAAALMLPYMFSGSRARPRIPRNMPARGAGTIPLLCPLKVKSRACRRRWWQPFWAAASPTS